MKKKNPIDNNLDQEYQLINNFIEIENCTKLCEAANKTVEKFYTQENLQKHITFTAGRYGDVDSLKGRDSYAFMIEHSSGQSDRRLPAIKFSELDPLIQKVSKLVEDKLEIKKGRCMLNFQRYYEDSAPLSLHYDHETYDVKKISGEKFPLLSEAIVPHKVAVLTLINNAVGVGTKITTKDKSSSIVVEYGPSDLLIFNNTRVLHGADAFNKGAKDTILPYIRYTMGWRSLDENCSYFNLANEKSFIPISYEETIEKHYDFMQNRWQNLLKYWLESGNTQRIMLYYHHSHHESFTVENDNSENLSQDAMDNQNHEVLPLGVNDSLSESFY